jgi:hypothetical protein
MRGHVHRIKAVLLDWLPRRLDPLAFYHWRRPLQNLLFLWLLSHLCLYPGRWLFCMAVIVTLVLLRRIAIQVGASCRRWAVEHGNCAARCNRYAALDSRICRCWQTAGAVCPCQCACAVRCVLR